jgi:tryptophan synthase alpha chain
MTGKERIETAFATALARQSAALMPYFTLGYPDEAQSLAVIEAIAKHSDLIELGVPFSDPIADGPTVQHSTQHALEAGATVRGCLNGVRTLRERGVTTPFLLMGYMNPILAYGMAQFVTDARDAGADGFIVPDLPPEEADELRQLVNAAGMALIYFLAPTSNAQRIALVTERAEGFIYMVSVAGVTGARSQVSAGLDAFVANVREQAQVPVAVGFGISTPEQAAAVGAFADGVIVGSALINAFDSAETDPVTAAADFVAALQSGLRA